MTNSTVRFLMAFPDWDNSDRVILMPANPDPRAVEVAIMTKETYERLRKAAGDCGTGDTNS